MAVYAIKSFLKVREAMSDYEYTAAEAHGVITTTIQGAMQSAIGAMVIAFGLTMFSKVVAGGAHSSGNPVGLWVGVWFETTEDRTKIGSAPGLLGFITSVVQSLKEKYGVSPKSIGFARLEPDVLASQSFDYIVVHVAVADMWATDRELTEQALRYVLPHEFGHYMMKSGHVKIPLPKGPKWREARDEWKEAYADEFAERESGMSREEANKVTNAIGRKMLGEES